MREFLLRWTCKAILLGVVDKSAAHEISSPAARIALCGPPAVLPGTVKVHTMCRRRLNGCVIGVVAVRDQLLWQTTYSFLAALQRGVQLAVVNGIGSGFHVDH